MSTISAQVIEDVYKNELLDEIIVDIRKAERANDRLAFGSYRKEAADEFKDHLERAKRKIDNLLRRVA